MEEENIMKLGKLETRELIDDSAMNESYKTLRTKSSFIQVI